MKSSILLLVGVLGTSLFSQNREVLLDNGKQFLLGTVTLEAFEKEPYSHWFQTAYERYPVDTILVNLFKENLGSHKIKLFLGTWCGDSRREVPRFLKILEKAEFPMDRLTMVALDGRREHYKTSPEGLERSFTIKRVPTFIFLKNDQEVSRIVESPLESLEVDMMRILSGKEYVPNYSLKNNK